MVFDVELVKLVVCSLTVCTEVTIIFCVAFDASLDKISIELSPWVSSHSSLSSAAESALSSSVCAGCNSGRAEGERFK